ncbi:hypothetical protein CRYUN_Cryun01aG0041500 [Craigia yunnanensis]
MAANDLQGYGQAYVVSEQQKLDWCDLIFLTTLPTETRKFKFWPLTLPSFKYVFFLDPVDVYTCPPLHQRNGSLLSAKEDCTTKNPPCSRPDLVLGVSPHSDGSALTLLLQDDEITSLQIKHKEEWIPVKPIPNSLVVNVGDATEILSSGMYKSIEHRAITNEKKARISIAAFAFPDEELEIGLVDSMVDDYHRPRMYQKVKYVDYMRQVLARKREGKAHTDLVKIENKYTSCSLQFCEKCGK